MTPTETAALRDSLMPSIIGVEHALGLGRHAELAFDDAGLWLDIDREGRKRRYPMATLAELDSGAYKSEFLPRLRSVYADFLRDDGILHVKEFLEARGPRTIEEGIEA